MLIFLGWSGKESKAVALALRDWLKMVCNAFDPWMSEMIEKGTRWSPAIAEQLRDSRAGIFTVTPDNLESPWLHFEAGAISNVENAKVCTFLRRVSKTAVTEPLGAFQHTVAGNDDDTLEMVKALWRQMPTEESRLKEPDLERAFRRWWPDLEKKLSAIQVPKGSAAPPKPSIDEMMGYALTMLRELVERDRVRSAHGPFARRGLTAAEAAQALGGWGHSPLDLLHAGTGTLGVTPLRPMTEAPSIPMPAPVATPPTKNRKR